VQKVDWSPGRPNAEKMSFNSADLGRHLHILQQTDIHIAGVGTAQMYQPFLRDGAVHFALGEPAEINGLCPRQYWEEYMTEGPPYLQSVYYARKGDLDLEHFKAVLRQAVALLKKPQIPHKSGSNLSPIGQVWKAYHQLLSQRNQSHTYVHKGHTNSMHGSSTAPVSGEETQSSKPLRLYSPAIPTFHDFHDAYICPSELTEEKSTLVNSCLIHELRKSFDLHYRNAGDGDGKGFFGLGPGLGLVRHKRPTVNDMRYNRPVDDE